MALERLSPTHSQTPERASDRGFALVSLLVLAPLSMAVLVALATMYFVLARKSAAQSACVRESARLQSELARQMIALQRLNRPAARLRRERAASERALRIAITAANPAAIASARAAQRAVLLAQLALRTRQNAILSAASFARTRAHLELRQRLRAYRVEAFRAGGGPPRGLAVRPTPEHALTPDYVPVASFAREQRQSYEFRLPLRPTFLPETWRGGDYLQPAACAATLKGDSKAWRVSILAVSARSNSAW